MPVNIISVSGLVSFTLAIMLLFCGKSVIAHSPFLRRYSIPEPVIGGFLCALVTALLHGIWGLELRFELGMSEVLLLYFFAGIGLKSEVGSLLKGGRPLLMLLLLATLFILLQNGLGMGLATLFGMPPATGLMVGSVSLTGGVGTTLAWAPLFSERLGIGNAMELGVASNTVGLVSACLIGGPIANHLIRRHRLQPSGDAGLEVGALGDVQYQPPLSYHDVLWAWMWLNLALLLGQAISAALAETNLVLPDFVGCLLAGILIRNLGQWLLGERRVKSWSAASQGLSLISDICLGVFLVMALMGMQLWQLGGYLLFIGTALTLQIGLTIAFTLMVLFPLLGRNYEASVMAAGFGGITLGSTATAIVNMSAVTQKYGAAHQAFIVVPLVCGFFIDIANALIIGLMSGL